MPGNCGLIGHIAGTIVQDGWNTWNQFATDTVEDVNNTLQAVEQLGLTEVPLNINFEVPTSLFRNRLFRKLRI